MTSLGRLPKTQWTNFDLPIGREYCDQALPDEAENQMKIKAVILASMMFTASALAADQTILPGTMYFENQGDLDVWQYVVESSNQRTVKNYQNVILREREAWKFVNPMKVKVVAHYPELHQSKVKILNCGRLYKSIFWIDDRNLVSTDWRYRYRPHQTASGHSDSGFAAFER